MTGAARHRHRGVLADVEARGLTAADEWLCSVGPVVGVRQFEIDEFSRVVRAIETGIHELLALLDRHEAIAEERKITA